MNRSGNTSAELIEDLLACTRLLGDASYQLGIVAGRLDEMGVKTGLRNVLAAHGSITKARSAICARAALTGEQG